MENVRKVISPSSNQTGRFVFGAALYRLCSLKGNCS